MLNAFVRVSVSELLLFYSTALECEREISLRMMTMRRVG